MRAPIAQPRLETVNSLAIVCDLTKNRKCLQETGNRPSQCPPCNQIPCCQLHFKIPSQTWGPELHKMCPRQSTQKGPLREDSQGGRGKLRGRWGAKSTHTTTLSKAGPGPLTPAEAPLLLSSKNHHLVHILQLCCKWAVFLPGKTPRRRKQNLLGSNSVVAGRLAAQVLHLLCAFREVT